MPEPQALRLSKFRVTQFRSVEDSGWIEVDSVTTLLGTNESGKSNLLLPLWKLNPATPDGAIDAEDDYPRKHYNEIRTQNPKPVFIRSRFEVSDSLRMELARLASVPEEAVAAVEVSKNFDNNIEVTFPEEKPVRVLPRSRVADALERARAEIDRATIPKNAETLKAEMLTAITSAAELLPTAGDITAETIQSVAAAIAGLSVAEAGARNSAVPHFGELAASLKGFVEEVSKPTAAQVTEAVDLVKAKLPRFVYYASYGNLDSEIYLPHVIANMKRTDLGQREEAKTRTLKVLFEFVKLKPEEIRELGHDAALPPGQAPTAEQIAEGAERRRKRDILLQAAGTALTNEFRDWWKQGTYRFRFQADGDHFRIWVSDDKRPEDIELEGRSTGLQWFLSFYLVFLVESKDAHEGAILLLDEPGHTLHPLAQMDLSAFFTSLSKANPLIYTSHSPFLIDYDRLDRVRGVFVKSDGTTGVSEDLRQAGASLDQVQSIYPAHAAIGLTVSQALLLGCKPVIVEGVSDQNYLSMIKTLLVAKGRLRPARELIFIPAGGVKGVKAAAALVSSKNDDLPIVLLDNDKAGRDLAAALKKDLYSGNESRVLIAIGLPGVTGEIEVEDLIPPALMAEIAGTALLLNPDEVFSDTVQAGIPMAPQIEAFAEEHGLELKSPGWKVELSKRIKARLLKGSDALADDVLDTWQGLFERLLA